MFIVYRGTPHFSECFLVPITNAEFRKGRNICYIFLFIYFIFYC